MNKTTFFASLLATALSISSCGDSKKSGEPVETENKEQTENTTATSEEEDIADFEFHMLIANMPTPLEEFVDLNTDHVSYNSELMAPVSQSKKHSSEAAVALNCGIYMVDLTYQTVYHQQDQLLAYLTAAHELAGKCGAEYAFNKVLRNGLQKNIDNKDSLQATIERGYEAMEEYLTGEGRIKTATQLLTGGWVETQHLMMQSLMKMPEPTKHLKEHVFEQRTHLANLLKLLGQFKSEAGLEAEHEKLVKLEESFSKIHETADVSHELLVELAGEIQEIRNDLIGM